MPQPHSEPTGLMLVIDVGSSAVKVGVFTETGSIKASEIASYATHSPEPGRVEQHAEDWWAAAAAATQAIAPSIDVNAIEAITVTNQQVTTVPVNSDLDPMAPAISWMDTRTSNLAARLESSLGDQILNTVGMPISSSWGALRPVWWMENEPSVASSSRWFLSVDAYFYGKLTGRVVTDHSNACFGPYDVRARTWSSWIADELGIDLKRLPPVVEPTERIGVLAPNASDDLGLPSGIPVIAGASDQPASAVGLGAISENIGAVTVGTGTFVVVPTKDPQPDRRYMVTCGAVPGEWIRYGLHYVSGAAFDWLVEIGGFEDVEELLDRAETSAPGAKGLILLPYLQGAKTPYFDHHARGVLYGLSLAHVSADIGRAFIESNAYGVRHVLETLEGSNPLDQVRLAGGGSRRPFVAQLIADSTRRQIEVPKNFESTSLGAALVGWTGLGAYPNVADAARTVISLDRSYTPDERSMAGYESAYRRYLRLYDALRPRFEADTK